jgi:hypothetical protein
MAGRMQLWHNCTMPKIRARHLEPVRIPPWRFEAASVTRIAPTPMLALASGLWGLSSLHVAPNRKLALSSDQRLGMLNHRRGRPYGVASAFHTR